MVSALAPDTLPALDLPDFVGADIGVLTREEIDLATHRIDPPKARHALYDLHHDYYEGRQRDPRGLRYGESDTTNERSFTSPHNVCAPLVDILTERLTVASFRVTAPDGVRTTQTDDIGSLLWRWWQAGRMDATARIAHRHTLTFGDAFVMVEWDPVAARPLYSLQNPRQITPM